MSRRARAVVILLTDRRELGAPLRLVSRHGPHATARPELARRFPSKRLARRWLSGLPAGHRIKTRYRPTLDTLEQPR